VEALLEDSSVLIGYSSLKIGLETEFVNQINTRFADYKRILKSNQKEFQNHSSSESEPPHSNQNTVDEFYRPLFYYVFGKFDLSVISLVDSSQFGLSNFRPANNSNSSSIALPFHRQIIYGPLIKTNKNYFNTILKVIKDDSKFPLIAITNIKLDDSILFDQGFNGLLSVSYEIEIVLSKYTQDNTSNFEFILIGDQGWHELNLI